LWLEKIPRGGAAAAPAAAAVRASTRFDGLAGSYSWTDGELASPSRFIRTFEVVGGRWVLVEQPE